MSERLLPCPFCGGEARIGLTYRTKWEDTITAFCAPCSASVSETGRVQSEATKRKVTETWNRRTPAPEGEAILCRLCSMGLKECDCISEPRYASPVVPVGISREEIARAVKSIERATRNNDGSPIPADYGEVLVSVSVLRAILATLRPTDTGWQDIATAPKGGGDILLNCGTDGCAIGRPNGDGTFDDGDFRDQMDGFTHWMPLPPAPTDTGKE